jgi:glutamyl-queuosine tRNA(Asp) synthetase
MSQHFTWKRGNHSLSSSIHSSFLLVPCSFMYCGRLAPSPTGFLHLGHSTTFRVAQTRARAAGGRLLLRIEDLDRERCRTEFAASLQDDLKWAGLAWDGEPVYQSDRLPMYLDAWRTLAALGRIYPCTCSRKDVERALSAPHPDDESEPLYPGTCRPAEMGARSEVAPGPVNWRFAVTPDEVVEFTDGHAGPQRFMAGRDFGDFVVWRKDGAPSYQLAVVVDDAAMAITEVVRGADLLASTAQQILLYRALGNSPPLFFHCPLVTDADGRRLAKRAGAHSLKSMREAGQMLHD